jgi:hypothetical protein
MADVATASVFYRKTAATRCSEVQALATLKADLGWIGTNRTLLQLLCLKVDDINT